MPNKLRVLSGKEVIDFCDQHGLKIISTKGSHVNLGQIEGGQYRFVTTVPLHRELDRGTLHAIFKRMIQCIPEAEVRKFFYTGNQ